MEADTQTGLRDSILAKAKNLGASLAGIASIEALRHSPSHALYHELPHHDGHAALEWPAEARSVLIMALQHRPSEPELDWWGGIPGRTPGNHQLMKMAGSLKEWLGKELDISARPLPYQVEQGGILLKDAAALAGLGVVGDRSDGTITSWTVPDKYVFVGELPKTSVGKIDKKVLRSQYRGESSLGVMNGRAYAGRATHVI